MRNKDKYGLLCSYRPLATCFRINRTVNPKLRILRLSDYVL